MRTPTLEVVLRGAGVRITCLSVFGILSTVHTPLTTFSSSTLAAKIDSVLVNLLYKLHQTVRESVIFFIPRKDIVI